MSAYMKKKISAFTLKTLANIALRLNEIYPGLVTILNKGLGTGSQYSSYTFNIQYTEMEVFNTLAIPLLKKSKLEYNTERLDVASSYACQMQVEVLVPKSAQAAVSTLKAGTSYLRPSWTPSIEEAAQKMRELAEFLEGGTRHE